MRQFSFFTGLVIIALIFSYCAEQKKVVHQQNQSSIYNPSTVIIRPEYSIFNNSDTTTQILTKIYLDEFLFNQANPEGVLRATVKMLFQLTDITKDSGNNVIADSVSFVRNLDRIQGRKYAVLGSQLKASLGKVYRLRIVATDIVKEISVQTFFTIDKRTHFSAQNFKVVDGATNTPLFRGYVNKILFK